MTFARWARDWLRSLERKETTRHAYKSSVDYAIAAFGVKVVRKVSTADVGALSRSMRDNGLGDSTRAKHLRVLSACFESAVAHGYAGQNPVKRIPKGEKPRARRKEAAFFEDAELPKLMQAISDPLWRTVVLVALKSGLREGELAALTWADVDLGGGLIHVRRTFTGGHLHVPKSHEKREVEITEDVVKLLGEWWGVTVASAVKSARLDALLQAAPGSSNSDLVFPRHELGGHIPDYAFTRQALYPAMKRAGIPRRGPTGEDRTFHSLRHTYARICLENGLLETWLQRQLGHSSLAVTVGIYGHWSRKGRAEQAAKLEGAFVV